MVEEPIEIHMSDGTSEGFLYRRDDGHPLPGVIHLTDIGGIRPAQREMARRLAEAGYCVLMPNIFYRTGRPPMLQIAGKPGDEQRMKRIAEISAPMTPEAMRRDTADYINFFANRSSVRRGMMGAVGYCFAGGMALRIAATHADRIAAVASFHGGRLFTEDPSSPHLLLPRVRAQLYFGHAVDDRSMPAEAIAKFNITLQTWGGKYESEVYEGCHHGWTVPDNPAFNSEQANVAFGKLTNLFQSAL